MTCDTSEALSAAEFIGTDRSAVQPLTGSRSSTTPWDAAKAVGHCALATATLLARRRLHQPRRNVGRVVRFADGTSAAVYRETVIGGGPPRHPAFLAVCFRLRLVRHPWAHALFRAESLLNTVLFAGFPGLESKLWLRHDQGGSYRGLYEWETPELAQAYVDALWWILALVSVPGSIRFAIVPGVRRDEALNRPQILDGLTGAQDAWWRPVSWSGE